MPVWIGGRTLAEPTVMFAAAVPLGHTKPNRAGDKGAKSVSVKAVPVAEAVADHDRLAKVVLGARYRLSESSGRCVGDLMSDKETDIGGLGVGRR